MNGQTRHGRLLRGVRWGGALMAVLALAALAVIGPPGLARASSPAGSYNQLTGVGTRSSAVTVKWAQGLLNASNQPITTAGAELSPNSDRSSASPKSPLSFMYNDFKNLQVTVGQTQDVGHQSITVTWTGGKPTPAINNGNVPSNFLQMMECYGDSPAGPSPEQCEYGAPNLLQQSNQGIGARDGSLCAAGVPSAANPPPLASGSSGVCDTYEPTSEKPPHCDPAAGPFIFRCTAPTYGYSIPFVPVSDPAHPIYVHGGTGAGLTTYFSQYNSNEVQLALTGSNGGGRQQFEALTSTEAPGLGCGERESNGHVRNCWLVIVPRGEYEPNGLNVQSTLASHNALNSSPLSASNWAQRIQVHLGYTPPTKPCPISTQERLTAGTQVITRAVQSWQFALNKAANCSMVYGFTSEIETTTTQDLSAAGSGTGLGFTTIPIGSEATRYPGGQAPTLPSILYAPVAVTALDFGFNINDHIGNNPDHPTWTSGPVFTPVKLTPELTARALTQVYRFDLPDYDPHPPSRWPAPPLYFPGPAWSQQNPSDISDDPAFKQLNPEVHPACGCKSFAPLLTLDHSALNQQVWQWVQSDPAASSWLNGTTGTSGPVPPNPDYTAQKLGNAPAIDNYPRLYNGKLDLGMSAQKPPRPEIKTSVDLLPYQENFDKAAANVLAGNDTETGDEWDTTVKDPSGNDGYWDPGGVEPIGQVFMWAANDTPDLAAYGLVGAQLCGPSGTGCVSPTVASVAKALGSATPDSKGLLQVNPAKVGAGGYPLVDVVYAAVPTNQSAAYLNDYANLIHFAAGQGQTIGSAPGDLPPGYLPLTARLKAQADAVVTNLRAIAKRTTGTPPHSPTGPGSPGSSVPPGSPGGTSGTAPGSAGSPGASPAGTTPRSSHGRPATGSPSAHLVAGTTPQTAMGVIRWVLLAVLIIGAAGAVGGTLLRTGQIPHWLHPRWLLHRARP
jgi:hypothetical protein